MKKYQKTITVYELPDGFIEEVHRDEEQSEYYISHKAYGIKALMFAMQIPDPETEEWLVEATAENYMAVYRAAFCDYYDDEEEA